MIFNTELERVCSKVDCQTCRCFDKNLKKCNGIGEVCFEYDEISHTCIDPISKLPIKILRR